MTAPSTDPRAAPAAGHDLQGRVVVVTGASSGIGAHLTGLLCASGANVVATARRGGRLEVLADSLDRERLHVVKGDITAPDFPATLIAEAVQRFGRLDVLVNNAGITNAKPAEMETDEDFLRVLSVNLVALFACCREAFAPMRDVGGGSIINIASALGLVGIGRIPQASYCAAKGGVVNLTRELAAQWAAAGIRVNCVAPGWFPTEMTDSMFATDAGMGYIQRTVPLRRPGRLEELDAIVTLLASGASSYVTGQTIAVDGGWTAV